MFGRKKKAAPPATPAPEPTPEAPKRLYRQGDVLLRQIGKSSLNTDDLLAVPSDERGRIVLAEGEVTGHAHVIEGEANFLARDLSEMNERYLEVESASALVHEEHDTLTIEPGLYEVLRQREYVPSEDSSRAHRMVWD